ncbi:hypothetical protein [Longispora fulva]|uniref:Uncharacterized protein n=1 Tax=Longispora fulva TaxID=619741 RepID=A0A8J7GDH0_9ACTN|nr:hypothetical protein [Longispora fulva]MBG6134452.1 hypothetical protein [Longispora fulva]
MRIRRIGRAVALGVGLVAVAATGVTLAGATGSSAADQIAAPVSVPLGNDAMTYAVSAGSDLPESLTKVQLQRIYRCYTTQISGNPVRPVLPRRGSGLRTEWLREMGIVEADVTNNDYPCLTDLGGSVLPDDGRILDANPSYIVPFSVGQYIVQANVAAARDQLGVTVVDRRGTAILGRIDNQSPIVGGAVNHGFPVTLRTCRVVSTTPAGGGSMAEMLSDDSWTTCNVELSVGGSGAHVTELLQLRYPV